MTEQKSTKLTPEEWKSVATTNATQLVNFLTAIPAMGKVEGSDEIVSGMNPAYIEQVRAHSERLIVFLGAWARSKPIVVEATQPQMAEAPEANGAVPPVKKRGRPRKVVEAQASQH